LLTESPEAKGEALEKTRKKYERYLSDVEYWNQSQSRKWTASVLLEDRHWGEANFSSHGTLFVGAFCNKQPDSVPRFAPL
jgi:hypothetical protein